MWSFQNIVVYIIVAAAVLWLLKKLLWNGRNGHSGCDNESCGCH